MPPKFRMPIAKASRKDPQQFRLYRMEQECFKGLDRAELTLKQIERFTRAVARNYRVPTPTIKFVDLGKWSGQCWVSGLIELNPKRRGSRSVLTIAHEMAHHIHNHLVPDKYAKHQSHGPEFLCCYMSLLDTARIMPLVATRALFTSYRLKFIDPGDVPDRSVLIARISEG